MKVILNINYLFIPEWSIQSLPDRTMSALFKPNSKSYFVSQYWASLNTSLETLASLNQDLDNTWKLIPKSEPTFQKFRVKILNFEKLRHVPRFLS